MAKCPLRRGNRSDRSAPQGVYPCAGRTIGALFRLKPITSGKHWQSSSAAKPLGTDARFENLVGSPRKPKRDRSGNLDMEQAIFESRSRSTLACGGHQRDRCAASTKSSTARLALTVFSQMAERRVGSMRTTKLPLYFVLRRSSHPGQRAKFGASIAAKLRAGG